MAPGPFPTLFCLRGQGASEILTPHCTQALLLPCPCLPAPAFSFLPPSPSSIMSGPSSSSASAIAPDTSSSAERPAPAEKPATAAHPPPQQPDPTLESNASQGRLAAAGPSAAAELARLKIRLKAALRQFPDFPSPGILFEDIMPLFADPKLHEDLVRALELHVSQVYEKPDVVVGLDARGFLFGPSLALRLGAGFVPVRKQGKLPGPCETAAYEKEYGSDFFQMQADGVKPGQKVLVVDDIIATGTLPLSCAHTQAQTHQPVPPQLTRPRWICLCCRLARKEARRHAAGLRLHPRTRLPAGTRQAGRARLHTAFQPRKIT